MEYVRTTITCFRLSAQNLKAPFWLLHQSSWCLKWWESKFWSWTYLKVSFISFQMRPCSGSHPLHCCTSSEYIHGQFASVRNLWYRRWQLPILGPLLSFLPSSNISPSHQVSSHGLVIVSTYPPHQLSSSILPVLFRTTNVVWAKRPNKPQRCQACGTK